MRDLSQEKILKKALILMAREQTNELPSTTK